MKPKNSKIKQPPQDILVDDVELDNEEAFEEGSDGAEDILAPETTFMGEPVSEIPVITAGPSIAPRPAKAPQERIVRPGPTQMAARGMSVDSPVISAKPQVVQPTAHVAVKPKQEVAVAQHQESSVIKGDLIISKVLLLQDMSDLVKARKAYAGQIVKSPSGEILGGIQNPGEPAIPVEIVPLTMTNSWTIMAAVGNKYLGSVPRTAENDSLPWQFVNEDGVECKRLKTIDLIALLSADIEKSSSGANVDEDGIPLNLDDAVLLPVAISFKSTSMLAGKFVATFFAKVEAATKQNPMVRPYHYTMNLSCYQESNDDGSFYVFEAGQSKIAPKPYREPAASWYDQLKSTRFKIEDESESEKKTVEQLKSRK